MPLRNRPLLRLVLWSLSLFVLPLTSFFAWDAMLGRIPSSYGIKRDAVLKTVSNAQVINLGTSREFDGIDPAAFGTPAINLANNGQDIYYDVEMVRYAIERLPNLKLILFGLYPNTLIRDINDTARVTLYYRVFGIPPKVRTLTSFLDPLRYAFARVYTVVQGFAFWIRDEDINVTHSVSPQGWTSHRGTRVRTVEHLEADVAKINSGQMIDPTYDLIIKKNVERLKDLKPLLDAHPGVRIVFFTVPTQPAYHRGLIPAGEARFREILGDLTTHFKTRHYDFLRDSRFSPHEYADGSHLNVLGAKRFSKILAQEVVAPELAR